MAIDKHSVGLSNELRFLNYLVSERFEFTPRRKLVLNAFLTIDRHVSAEEFYQDLLIRHPDIGSSTVYRMLKLMVESGIAREISFLSGPTLYYEQVIDGDHHGHLICTRCKTISDYKDESIENLQVEIATSHGFLLEKARLEIYGLCSGCRH